MLELILLGGKVASLVFNLYHFWRRITMLTKKETMEQAVEALSVGDVIEEGGEVKALSSGIIVVTNAVVYSDFTHQGIVVVLGEEADVKSVWDKTTEGGTLKFTFDWKAYRDSLGSDEESEDTDDDTPADVNDNIVDEDDTKEEPKAEKPKAKSKPKKDDEPVVINSIDNAEEEFKTAMEDAGYKVRSRSRGVGFFTKVAGIRQLKRSGEWEITFYMPEDKKEKVVFDDEALVRLEELLEEVSEEKEEDTSEE